MIKEPISRYVAVDCSEQALRAEAAYSQSCTNVADANEIQCYLSRKTYMRPGEPQSNCYTELKSLVR